MPQMSVGTIPPQDRARALQSQHGDRKPGWMESCLAKSSQPLTERRQATRTYSTPTQSAVLGVGKGTKNTNNPMASWGRSHKKT